MDQIKLTWAFNHEGETLTVTLTGRLDTLTTPKLEQAIEPELDGVKNLILEMRDLVYISSSGLRLIMNLVQLVSDQGTITARHVSQDLMSIFRMTGFNQLMTIE